MIGSTLFFLEHAQDRLLGLEGPAVEDIIIVTF